MVRRSSTLRRSRHEHEQHEQEQEQQEHEHEQEQHEQEQEQHEHEQEQHEQEQQEQEQHEQEHEQEQQRAVATKWLPAREATKSGTDSQRKIGFPSFFLPLFKEKPMRKAMKPNVKCQMSKIGKNVKCQMSNVICQMSSHPVAQRSSRGGEDHSTGPQGSLVPLRNG